MGKKVRYLGPNAVVWAGTAWYRAVLRTAHGVCLHLWPLDDGGNSSGGQMPNQHLGERWAEVYLGFPICRSLLLPARRGNPGAVEQLHERTLP